MSLENEYDQDDPRSQLWVLYKSNLESEVDRLREVDRIPTVSRFVDQDGNNDSAVNDIPIATTRLVPPPHLPHHTLSSAAVDPNDTHDVPGFGIIEADEPYIKLGRLAVLREGRGKQLGPLLMNAAIEWAMNHPLEMLGYPPRSQGSLHNNGRLWNGLILIHAQKGLQRYYQNSQFVHDESMGTWDEEGIDHIGMWRRVDVRKPHMTSTNTHIPGAPEL